MEKNNVNQSLNDASVLFSQEPDNISFYNNCREGNNNAIVLTSINLFLLK